MPFDSEFEVQPGWTDRSVYWLNQSQNKPAKRPKRQRPTEPLILCGQGVSLNIERDTLLIRNGFTHYPQERETFRFFPGDMALPPRIIMLDGSGSISFDVLAWLSEQRVPLIFIDWRGKVVTVAGGAGFAGDREKVSWQTETRADPERRLRYSTDLIREKVAGSIETLAATLPSSDRLATAVDRLHRDLSVLDSGVLADVTALRAVEARASAAYFAGWHGAPIKFKTSARSTVPEEWRTIGSRSAVRVGKVAKNERATHPLNAMLNYGYAVLQANLKIDAVAAGYDPTIGIMHHGYKGSAAYIFDLMEPERPVVDRAVLSLTMAETFAGSDFVIRSDGVCRLSPQLARLVCSLTIKSKNQTAVSNASETMFQGKVRPEIATSQP